MQQFTFRDSLIMLWNATTQIRRGLAMVDRGFDYTSKTESSSDRDSSSNSDLLTQFRL